jgi:hypothetical protein
MKNIRFPQRWYLLVGKFGFEPANQRNIPEDQ